MHEPIRAFPKGKTVGSVRLAKRDQVVDVIRLVYGSRTRFVERVLTNGRDGAVVTALRKTDDFPATKSADRFISSWLQGIVGNRGYRIIHEDPGFRKREADSAT